MDNNTSENSIFWSTPKEDNDVVKVLESQDPLEIKISPTAKLTVNKRGRPKSGEATEFSPMPKSLFISELKSEINKRRVPILNETNEIEKFVLQEGEANKNVLVEEKQLVENVEVEEENSTFEMNITSNPKRNKADKFKSRSKDQIFVCDFSGCNYSCKLSCNLKKHKRVHTSEKPYICDQCLFRTNFVNSLKVHKRIHTSERPYSCKQCSYRCNSISNLKKHCLHRHPTHQSAHT